MARGHWTISYILTDYESNYERIVVVVLLKYNKISFTLQRLLKAYIGFT